MVMLTVHNLSPTAAADFQTVVIYVEAVEKAPPSAYI